MFQAAEFSFAAVDGTAKSAPSNAKTLAQGSVEAAYSDLLKAQPTQPKFFILYFRFDKTELTAESKAMLLEAISGAPGLPRDIVAMNAGAALYASGVAQTIADGIARAMAAIDSGAARARLDDYVETTRRLARP